MPKKLIAIIAGILIGIIFSALVIFYVELTRVNPGKSGAVPLQNPSPSPQTTQQSTPSAPVETSQVPSLATTPETEVLRFLSVLFIVNPPQSLDTPEAQEAQKYLTAGAKASLVRETGLAGFAKVEKLEAISYTVLEVKTENNVSTIKTRWKFQDSEVFKTLTLIPEDNTWKINSID